MRIKIIAITGLLLWWIALPTAVRAQAVQTTSACPQKDTSLGKIPTTGCIVDALKGSLLDTPKYPLLQTYVEGDFGTPKPILGQTGRPKSDDDTANRTDVTDGDNLQFPSSALKDWNRNRDDMEGLVHFLMPKTRKVTQTVKGEINVPQPTFGHIGPRPGITYYPAQQYCDCSW